MINETMGLKSLPAAIWREVSSLWSGAEFAFLEQDTVSNDFDLLAPLERPCLTDCGQSEACR
jgi:hypothetical protein